MFYYSTAWYMCVIAWLERQFGLPADPFKQCMQTVVERPLRTPVERVLRRLDGAARGAIGSPPSGTTRSPSNSTELHMPERYLLGLCGSCWAELGLEQLLARQYPVQYPGKRGTL
jgi:hypothetical protein